jgi:hypothetical protein
MAFKPFNELITFSRGTHATIVDATGKITYAPNNLVLRSEEFDNASWTKTASTITPNAAVAPNDTTTADTITADGTSNTHNISQNVTYAAATHTLSVYAKKDTNDFVQLRFATAAIASGTGFANFDLNAGTVGTVGAGLSAASITPADNGWYRCAITGTTLAASTNFAIYLVSSASATSGQSNTLDTSIFLWGAQLEQVTYQTQPSTYNSTTPANLLGFTQEFNNSAWTKTNSTIATNVAIAPDGTLSADKHIPNNGATLGSGASETRVYQSPTLVIGSTYTYSIYAKAGEFDEIELSAIVTPSQTARFSLTLGTVVSGSGANKSITYVENGWYRCAFTATSGQGSGVQIRWSAETSAGLPGDGTSGIFVWGAQLSNSGSLDPYVYNPGAIPSSTAYYGPRFDYDPITLAPKGLLIETTKTNLLLRSEEFDNASWSKDNSTITSNADVAPDGTTTADKLIANNSVDLTSISNGVARISASYSASATLTFSVFAKEAEFDRIQLYFSEGTGTTNRAQVEYSLVNGSVVTAASVAGTFTSPSSTSTYFGNGWYRFTLTFTAGTGTTARARFGVRDSGTTTGDGTSGILIWGAQVEAGAFATSYIPTAASTVNRATDSAVMTNSNFLNWFNATEGTFVVSASVLLTTGNRGIYAASDGTNTNRIYLNLTNANPANANHFIATGGAETYEVITNSLIFANTVFRDAFAYSTNYLNGATNGVLGTANTAVILPVVDQFRIGARGDNGNRIEGHVRNIIYYPTRLTDAQLQALTL